MDRSNMTKQLLQLLCELLSRTQAAPLTIGSILFYMHGTLPRATQSQQLRWMAML